MRSIAVSIAIAAATLSMASASFAKSAAVPADNDRIVLRPSSDGKTFCTPAQTVTGSILPQKVCKTRAEWQSEIGRAKSAG